MKIHNYGNDYVQARKFNEINNAGNRIAKDESTTSREVCSETATKEETKTKKASKKKEQDSTDNI